MTATPVYMLLADTSSNRRRSGEVISTKNLTQAEPLGLEEYLLLSFLITI